MRVHTHTPPGRCLLGAAPACRPLVTFAPAAPLSRLSSLVPSTRCAPRHLSLPHRSSEDRVRCFLSCATHVRATTRSREWAYRGQNQLSTSLRLEGMSTSLRLESPSTPPSDGDPAPIATEILNELTVAPTDSLAASAGYHPDRSPRHPVHVTSTRRPCPRFFFQPRLPKRFSTR